MLILSENWDQGFSIIFPGGPCKEHSKTDAKGTKKHNFLTHFVSFEADKGPSMKGWQAGFDPQAVISEPLTQAATF